MEERKRNKKWWRLIEKEEERLNGKKMTRNLRKEKEESKEGEERSEKGDMRVVETGEIENGDKERKRKERE